MKTPAVFPDWVYAYTATIKRRLEGRNITLIGYVKSMVSGKSTFLCSNGHKWRTTPIRVAEGEGCPVCGIGERASEEINKMVNAGTICLLVHPDKPGFVKIGLEAAPMDGWEAHRYRNVEDLDLGETIAWKLLGHPLPHSRDPIALDLDAAEEAFRHLHYAIQEKLALEEKKVSNVEGI